MEGLRVKFLIDNLLRLLPIHFSYTIDARIEEHACLVTLSIAIMATHFIFFSIHIDLIHISVISAKIAISL